MSTEPVAAAVKDWHGRSRSLRPDGRALIDGQRRVAVDGRSFDALSPIDGRKLGPVARGDRADVDAAVVAARRAFDRAAGATSSRSSASACCCASPS